MGFFCPKIPEAAARYEDAHHYKAAIRCYKQVPNIEKVVFLLTEQSKFREALQIVMDPQHDGVFPKERR